VKYLTGICAVLFTLCAPVITLAGLFTAVGVSGPVGLCLAAGLMIGVWALLRERRL
jgi:hypothetical protein